MSGALVRGRVVCRWSRWRASCWRVAGGPAVSVAAGGRNHAGGAHCRRRRATRCRRGSPVSPTPSTTSATPTVIQNTSANTSGGSTLSSGSTLFIAIGAVIVLGGISFFIWRDARRRAPERGGEGYEIRRSGTKPPAQAAQAEPGRAQAAQAGPGAPIGPARVRGARDGRPFCAGGGAPVRSRPGSGRRARDRRAPRRASAGQVAGSRTRQCGGRAASRGLQPRRPIPSPVEA